MHSAPEGLNRDGLYLPGHELPVGSDLSDTKPSARPTSWAEVPWRTILATVGILVLTYALIVLVLAAARILMWIAVAGFMAVVLYTTMGEAALAPQVGGGEQQQPRLVLAEKVLAGRP